MYDEDDEENGTGVEDHPVIASLNAAAANREVRYLNFSVVALARRHVPTRIVVLTAFSSRAECLPWCQDPELPSYAQTIAETSDADDDPGLPSYYEVAQSQQPTHSIDNVTDGVDAPAATSGGRGGCDSIGDDDEDVDEIGDDVPLIARGADA